MGRQTDKEAFYVALARLKDFKSFYEKLYAGGYSSLEPLEREALALGLLQSMRREANYCAMSDFWYGWTTQVDPKGASLIDEYRTD